MLPVALSSPLKLKKKRKTLRRSSNRIRRLPRTETKRPREEKATVTPGARRSTKNIQIMVAKPQCSSTKSLPFIKTSTTFRNPKARFRNRSLFVSSAKKSTQIHFRLLNTSVAEFSTLNIDAQSATKSSAALRTWRRTEDGIDRVRRTKRSQLLRKCQLPEANSYQTVRKPAVKTAKMVSRPTLKVRCDRPVRSEIVKGNLCAKYATKHSDEKPT